MRLLRKSTAMAEFGVSVLLLCHLSCVFGGIYGFLDLEELKSVNYGIDIEDTPIMFKESMPDGSIRLASRLGQQYQCSYPEGTTKQKQEEKERIALETGIPELLKPMETGPCLIYDQGWWTYEFCYGKYIRQFHGENGKIIGDIYYLGHYESEYDWKNASDKQENRLNRYHSQRYVNGTMCDLSGQTRQTEVRFLCADGKGDYVGRLEEPESCVYVLTVYTTKICRHPYLKAPAVNIPLTITCSPLLDSDQYQHYLDTRQDSAAPQQAVNGDQSVLSPDDMAALSDGASLDKSFTESLVHGIREMLTENGHGKAGLPEDVLRTARDIAQSIRKQLRLQTDKAKRNQDADDDDDDDDEDTGGDDGTTVDVKVKVTASSDEKKKDTVNEDDEDDNDIFDEFDKGLDKMSESGPDKTQLASHSDAVRSALHAQFKDIIEEAQEELAQEATDDEPPVTVDKVHTYKKLSKTLNALLSRLQTAQKDIKDMDEALETVETDSSQEKKMMGEKEDMPGADRMGEIASQDKTGDIASQEKTPTVEDQTDIDPPSAVTRTEDTKERIADAPVEDYVDVGKTIKSDKGAKVQVQFVTLGYYNDDGTIQFVSGDDKSSVSKVMVAVLGIGSEASREAEKHQRITENYGIVWQKKTNHQRNEVPTHDQD